MSYEAGRRCEVCGDESPYTPVCGECHVAQRGDEAAELAHAAGYAEAVADVVAWMRKGNLDDCRAADEIEDGYAVGAAKKGAT